MEEAQGAQLAARDAQEAKTAAITQGFEGLTSMGAQAGGMIDLYNENKAERKALADLSTVKL